MGIIRLLLALSVVAVHAGSIFGFNLVGGPIAVQSFYIISGFYMSLILNEKYVGQNNSYRLFITNRFIRLFPVYWTVLLLTVFFSLGVAYLSHGATYGKFDSYLQVGSNLPSFLYLMLANLVVFGQDVAMFLGITPESGQLFFAGNIFNSSLPVHSFLFIPQAWTLGLELMFYLVAPFIVRRGPKLVTSILLSSFLLRLFLYDFMHLQNDPWTYRFFPTELMFFLLGYMSYQIHLKIKERKISRGINLSILTFMIVFTFLYEFLPEGKYSYSPFSLKELIYFSAIITFIPFLFNFLKKIKWDNRIGELSYPVYISHMLVIMICGGLHLTVLKAGWCIAIITLLFSMVLNQLIASRFEVYRQARLKRSTRREERRPLSVPVALQPV
jgi:peptidoglycan/LPS O-acetylase OafA/YrhL